MSYETPDGVQHIDKNEARGGRKVKGMPIVLGVSIAAIVVVMIIAFAVIG